MASQDRRLTAAAGTPRPSWRVLDLVASFKQEQEDDHTSYRVHVLSGEIAGTGTGNLRSFFANEAGGDRVQSGASGRQTHLQSYLSNCVETRGGVSWLGLSWRYALGMLAYGAFFFLPERFFSLRHAFFSGLRLFSVRKHLAHAIDMP